MIHVDVDGVEQNVAAFRFAGPAVDVGLVAAYQEIALTEQAALRSAAGGATRQQAAAAAALTALGRPDGVEFEIGPVPPFARGAFLGSARYPQFPAPAGAAGPYVMAPTLARDASRMANTIEQAAIRALRTASLDVT